MPWVLRKIKPPEEVVFSEVNYFYCSILILIQQIATSVMLAFTNLLLAEVNDIVTLNINISDDIYD